MEETVEAAETGVVVVAEDLFVVREEERSVTWRR